MVTRSVRLVAVVVGLASAALILVAPVAARPDPTRFRLPSPCPLPFPATNVWNKRIDARPVRSDSATLLATMGLSRTLHPDFGSFAGYGIPVNTVSTLTPRSTVTFTWPTESDRVGYPIPATPLIEGAGAPGDRHILMVDKRECRLWELFAASSSGGRWSAGSGATWDLRSNALRPDGWTSADAAGLPIYAGLARYDEVAAGTIDHALRFTVPTTRSPHIYPARHDAGAGTSASLPPMGLRLRLKASVSLSGFGPQSQVILTALKRYGMFVADNGSNWFISGAPDSRWKDDELRTLRQVKGRDFEVVRMGTIVTR